MGIFDFLKGAGRKVDEGSTKPVREVTPEQFQAARAKARATAMAKLVTDHGLSVEGLQVEVAGDRVTVRGTADTQATREKVVLLLGNVNGIAQVDDQLTVAAPPEPQAVFHTVVSGDTLSKIAKKYYGNANQYMKIFEANKPMLEHPDKIYPGQALRIPDAAQPAEKP